jgi:UDP-N-acetylglucosamine 2-epimerase (non-hydrolysing)
MRVICVAGARPNFMKIKPVMDALESRHVELKVVHTGQHYDMSMSTIFYQELGIREPDFYLGVGSGTHAQQTAKVMESFEPIVAVEQPDVVVVVGDVNSTMACALVTAKSQAKLAHVEAGLRSGDWTMPEEVNRVVTDRVSDYLFAPSADAVENLRAEGQDPARIHLVGNVMVDTLFSHLEAARRRPTLSELGVQPGEYGLVTLHRPATVDDPESLASVVDALGKIARQCPLLFPMHPRVAGRLTAVTVPPALRVLEPLGYLDFLCLESSARVVLTDSGGVQEETTMLGVPCLTIRDNTERPITVLQGTNKVVGRDPQRIVTEALRVLREGVVARRPALWDGRAAERIAAVVVGSG